MQLLFPKNFLRRLVTLRRLPRTQHVTGAKLGGIVKKFREIFSSSRNFQRSILPIDLGE
jgi:hypothetical protein